MAANKESEKMAPATTERKSGDEKAAAVKSKTPWPLVTIGVFATIVVIALVVAGIGAAMAMEWATTTRPDGDRTMIENRTFGDRWQRGGGMFDDTTSDIVRGVVVSIDGNKLTIAGGGERTTVTMTDDTMISGDADDIAVDDSVVVRVSEADDGSLEAVRIIVRNETTSPWGDMMERQQSTVPHA